jgi:pseudouridylate synthase
VTTQPRTASPTTGPPLDADSLLESDVLAVADDVRDALASGVPVVALESTIISHGLPRPENLRVATEVEDIVRSRGAVPATIAILDGRVRVGLDEAALVQVANRDDIVKVSVRDIATLVSRRGSGATTVAATSHLAHLIGIRVFATGGLGGVHRQARDSWDESADLGTLAETPMTVVCSGVKSILDVGATLERLETLNVGVLGFGTRRFPGFYLTDSGFGIDWSADDADAVASVMRMRDALRIRSALVVANPLPESEQLDPDVHDHVLEEGLRLASARNVTGKDVTPFLLDHFHRATHGASLIVNEQIIVRNAELAARIAVSDAGTR